MATTRKQSREPVREEALDALVDRLRALRANDPEDPLAECADEPEHRDVPEGTLVLPLNGSGR
jgi:hypothetical protein